jgi:phosphatidylglycerophosphate synthase
MSVTVLIDARAPLAGVKVYSVTLLERILRQLHELDLYSRVARDVKPGTTLASYLERKTAIVLLPADVTLGSLLRPEFHERFPLHLTWLHDPTPSAVDETVETLGTEVVVLEADGLYDERIIEALLTSESPLRITDENTADAPLALRCRLTDLALEVWGDVIERIRAYAETGAIPTLSVHRMSTYLQSLRRHVVPQLERVTNPEAIRGIENRMYANTFKGAMEFVGAYGYRIPVRGLTRLFARTNITPNALTGWSVACKLAAIPFFAMGWIWTGLCLAWGFVLLDSVDGKLARMIVRYSGVAGVVDRRTTLASYMLWYMAMGWHFSGGNLLSLPAAAGFVMAIMALLDKLGMMYFVRTFGRSLLDYEPIDWWIHLFNARKNLLAVLMLGLLIGRGVETFYLVAGWMVLTFLAHVARIIWVSLAHQRQRHAGEMYQESPS